MSCRLDGNGSNPSSHCASTAPSKQPPQDETRSWKTLHTTLPYIHKVAAGSAVRRRGQGREKGRDNGCRVVLKTNEVCPLRCAEVYRLYSTVN